MRIKQVFQDEIPDLKIDRNLLKKMTKMETSFVNKNQDHIEFFGGALTGVQVVRFTQEDRDDFFSDILVTDEAVLQEKLYALKDNYGVPVINQEFKVSSDVFNISCVWLIHAIENSRYLSDKEKTEGKIEVCLYMLYRFLTSRLFRLFIYPADESTAKATYEQLSYKYLLKQTGSWNKCLRTMAGNLTGPESPHRNTIEKMDDDIYVVRMMNDIQGRIRDMLKNIYGEFIMVHQKGVRIGRNSSFVEMDGEEILKDKHKSLENYKRYIKSIIADKNSFIKQELVDIVCNMMHTMSEKLLVESLEWTSNNFGHMTDQLIDEAVDAVMHHAFDYLFNHNSLVRKKEDLAGMISKLRGTYMSSRANEDNIVEARALARRIITSSTKTKNESAIAATRTGWMIYVVIRSLTMRHYTN